MTDIVKQESVLAEYNPEQLEILRTQIAKGCTDAELKYYLTICKHLDLNPFNRQIYAVKRKSWNNEKKDYDENVTVQMGIDGFRLIAERSGKYAGSNAPRFEWSADGKKLIAAYVTVKKLVGGIIVETEAVAYYEEYVQTYKDKTTQEWKPNAQWVKMPRLMLWKCAEALALRKAFPQELSGVYSEDEVITMNSHAEETAPVEIMATTEQKAKLLELIAWTGAPEKKFFDADKVADIDGYTQVKAQARIDYIERELAKKAEEKPVEATVEEEVPETNDNPA